MDLSLIRHIKQKRAQKTLKFLRAFLHFAIAFFGLECYHITCVTATDMR